MGNKMNLQETEELIEAFSAEFNILAKAMEYMQSFLGPLEIFG